MSIGKKICIFILAIFTMWFLNCYDNFIEKRLVFPHPVTQPDTLYLYD